MTEKQIRDRMTWLGATTLLREVDAQRKAILGVLASLRFNKAMLRRGKKQPKTLKQPKETTPTPSPRPSPRKGIPLSKKHKAAIARGLRRARRKRNADALAAAQRDDE